MGRAGMRIKCVILYGLSPRCRDLVIFACAQDKLISELFNTYLRRIMLVSWTRPSFLQRWMYSVTSTRKEGLGTLAIRLWHLQECVQSQSDCSCHMTTVELTARRHIQGGARYACAHYACTYFNIVHTCGILPHDNVIWLQFSVPRPSIYCQVSPFLFFCVKSFFSTKAPTELINSF